MKFLNKNLIYIITFFFLTSCTLTEKQTTSNSQRVNVLEQVKNFNAEGKLGIITKEDAISSSFVLKQRDKNYNINISGPFGQGEVQVVGNDNYIDVKTSDGQQFSGTNPQRVLEQNLGMSVPVHLLRYWVFGQIPPNSQPEYTSFYNNGLLSSINQDGWQIDYKEYRITNGMQMPVKFEAVGFNTKLKFVVIDWQGI